VYIENRKVVGLDPADPIATSYKNKIGTDPTGKENPDLLTMKPSHGHDATIVNGISRIGWMSGGKAARWNDETLADTFAGKAVSFIERSKDAPFFLYFATHDIHVPRVPSPPRKGKSGCGTRGDVIQQFDDAVGAVLAALDRLKLADNTLVILSSDNGGVMDDGYADGAIEDANGHLCNGSLRGYKGSLWEGGTREPFIARWPGRIKAGGTSDEQICLVDMQATFAAVAGQPLPAAAAPDSFNVLPALLGEKREKPVRDHLVMQTNGTSNLAIRKGPWKLIPANAGGGYAKAKAKAEAKGPAAGPQLFNLADDLAETKNVAADHPEIVKELSALLEEIRTKGRSRPTT
jgi:arylsulfatase A-like enzyme